MAEGAAKVTNTPNFLGALFQADQRRTQFLTLIGGTNGANSKIATAVEFPISVNYKLGTPEQPKISENDSMGEAKPEFVGLSQNTNVIQIHQKDIQVSNLRQRAKGVLSGLAVAGQTPERVDEQAFQLMAAIEQMKMDMNYSAINGKFAKGGLTDSAQALGTRGILEAIETNVIKGELNDDNISEMIRLVHDSGSFVTPVLFANSKNRRAISKAYKAEGLTEVDRDRLSGGVAVGKIVTEFGEVYLATDNLFGDDVVALVDIAQCSPVFTRDDETGEIISVKPRDGRGGTYLELYAEFGLDHGDELNHAKLEIESGE